tara:strand:+ start:50 stop:229 length:180 start_codon:yes stop_codon:yes gene_type:complete
MNDKEGQELYESISNSIEDKLGGSWQGNQVRIIIKEIVLKEIKKFVSSEKKNNITVVWP